MKLSPNKFRILLLGIGTVGGALLRLLAKLDSIEVIAVMSRNAAERLKNQAPEYLTQLTAIFNEWQDLQKALEQTVLAKPDAVVELLGGDSCLPIYRYFLEQQIPIITANKALLAEHGAELFPLAQKNDTFIAAEASCGGGIPLLQTLLYGSYQIYEIHGVLNGTCNYILSQMVGRDYSEVLAEAQSVGLAEADPFLDVSGTDSAHKIVILAMMSFGVSLPLKQVILQGIEQVCSEHIQAAQQLGLSLKLVASAQWNKESHEGQLAMRVGPCFVASANSVQHSAASFSPISPLAELSSSFNGVSLYSDNAGHIYLQGRGAGASATATAVLSDLHQVTTGVYDRIFKHFTNWPAPNKLQTKNTWASVKRNWLIFVPSEKALETPFEPARLSAQTSMKLLLTLESTKVYLLRDTAQEDLAKETQTEITKAPDKWKCKYIPILDLPAEEKLSAERPAKQ